MISPPSIRSEAPVIHFASGDTRYPSRSAISVRASLRRWPPQPLDFASPRRESSLQLRWISLRSRFSRGSPCCVRQERRPKNLAETHCRCFANSLACTCDDCYGIRSHRPHLPNINVLVPSGRRFLGPLPKSPRPQELVPCTSGCGPRHLSAPSRSSDPP